MCAMHRLENIQLMQSRLAAGRSELSERPKPAYSKHENELMSQQPPVDCPIGPRQLQITSHLFLLVAQYKLQLG